MPTHFRGDPQIVLALDTFIKFTRASSALEAYLFRDGILEGLTPSQFGVLETLYHLGPLCQGEISHKLLKSSGNITLVLDNLEKRGLIERQRSHEDRRMVTIVLTDSGRDLIERVFPRQAALIAEAFSPLSPEEQRTLGELCKKLGLALQQKDSPNLIHIHSKP